MQDAGQRIPSTHPHVPRVSKHAARWAAAIDFRKNRLVIETSNGNSDLFCTGSGNGNRRGADLIWELLPPGLSCRERRKSPMRDRWVQATLRVVIESRREIIVRSGSITNTGVPGGLAIHGPSPAREQRHVDSYIIT